MIYSEEKLIKSTIKKLMKKKFINQETLATRLGTSLPTVRRILTKERLSLDRLIEICRILEIELNDLVSIAVESKKRYTYLSEEQEKFFAANPHYYQYLRQLGRGLKPSDIELETSISIRSTKKYLLKLESLGIIKIKSKDEIKLLIEWPHTFRFPGPLQKKFHKNMGRTLTDHLSGKVADNIDQWGSDHFYFIHSMQLTPQSYKSCVRDFYNLHLKYRQIAKVDQETRHWHQLISVGAILGVDQFEPANTFGPIKEI